MAQCTVLKSSPSNIPTHTFLAVKLRVPFEYWHTHPVLYLSRRTVPGLHYMGGHSCYICCTYILQEYWIGQVETSYIDGSIGYNNPSDAVINQAHLCYHGQKIACIISIRTGLSHVAGILKSNLWQRLVPTNVIKAMIAVATDCEYSSESTARHY